jgi:hypothetical protein
MSQENVEIVRSVLSEFAETQKLSELVSPELVWDMGSWSAWSGLRAGFLYTVENGLLVRCEVYTTLEEALDAARLRE